jgi:hypothetical protein
MGIFNLDVATGDGIPHCSVVTLLALLRRVVFRISSLCLLLRLGVYGGVPLFLLSVESLHKLLYIRHSIAAAVVLARGHDMLIDVHCGCVIPY